MAIRVKHAPSAAALGETAYTIGRGAKRERDRRFGADVYFRYRGLQLQEEGLEQQAERAAEVSRIADEQLGLRREELEYKKEGALAEREFAEHKWEEEPSRQLEKSLQQQEFLRKNITWQYDEGQKRELAKITTGVAWIRTQVAAGKWTAEQGEDAERQLWQKYYSISPLPVYDDKPKPQEMFNSAIATDITGSRYMQKGNGDWEQLGISFKDDSTFFANLVKAMSKQNALGEDKTNYKEIREQFLKARTLFDRIRGLPAKVEEEQRRLQAKKEQDAADEEQEEEEMNEQAKIEALPTMFSSVMPGQPKIGRIKKGKSSRDKVYGEEAYNKALLEVVERGKQIGIPPDVMKAEFDKWWDEQYDKYRGDSWQVFGNRMEFEAAPLASMARRVQATPAEPTTVEEFESIVAGLKAQDMEKAKAYYDKWVGKWQ